MKNFTLPFVLLLAVSCARFADYTPTGVKESKNTFRVAWSKNNDPIHNTGNLPISLNSPLIFEDFLFVGHNDGKMMAYQIDNGRKIWEEEDGSSYHSAPVVYKKSVIYGTTGGRLYSRDMLTGKLNYAVELGASVETAGTIYKGRIFLQLRNHKIFCIDAATGKILWGYKRQVPFLTTVQRASKPVIYGGKLYVGFADGSITALSIEEGLLLWERKIADGTKFLDVDTTPVFFSGKLLVGSFAGHITILEPRTGALIRKIPKVVSRSPLIDKNLLVYGTFGGEFIVFDRKFEKVKSVKLSESGISDIVVWKGHYVASTVSGELFMLDRTSLKVLDKIHLGHATSAIFGEMSISDGTLALLSSRNRLYVYR